MHIESTEKEKFILNYVWAEEFSTLNRIESIYVWLTGIYFDAYSHIQEWSIVVCTTPTYGGYIEDRGM